MNLKYGYVRAKTRAVIAAASASLVVVPLTGAAAVALVNHQDTPDVVLPDLAIVAEQSATYGDNLAGVNVKVTASSDAEFDFEAPEIAVKDNPPPPPPPPARSAQSNSSGGSGGSAQPVANSSSVNAAISGSDIIAEAAKHVGTPYVGGGSSPGGFDCTGFTSYVFGQFGISLPRTSGAYYNIGTRVDSPQPGDLIVSPGHVGIYAGPNLQIDAPRPGKSIQFRGIWQKNPTYIRVT